MLSLLVSLPSLTTAPATNTALVFIKPHAATDAWEGYIKQHLSSSGIRIIDSGVKYAAEIDSNRLIDQHYGSLARLAVETQPAEMELSSSAKKSFADTFGVEWDAALGSVLRNDAALAKLGVDGAALEALWRQGDTCKLAPGTYVSRLAGQASDAPLYTVNGFYPAMREAFVADGAEVRYLVCEFEEDVLSWRAFRRDVIGATDPEAAADGSARAALRASWEELGLDAAPSTGNNGVHASAGPLEGLKERCVWAGATLESDAFAQQLLGAGLERATLEAWLDTNPVVTLEGKTDKVFDLTEEMSAAEVLRAVASR